MPDLEHRITHRRVLRTSVPIILSNTTVPLLGAVDLAVVGQMGHAAPAAAVGFGAVVISTLYWFFGFLRMGTSGQTAQAHGAGDTAEVTAILYRAVLIGLIGGACVTFLQWPILFLAQEVSDLSSQADELTAQYFAIRIWFAPFSIATYGVWGWLIGLERTRDVLVLQLWITSLNAILDIVFVLGFDWGVAGVAWATVLAEVTGLILAAYLCREAILTRIPDLKARVFAKEKWKSTYKSNTDILLRSVFLETVMVGAVLYATKQGDATVAAYQIMMQFLAIVGYALDGVAFTAETLVGQAYGAKAPRALHKAVKYTGFWCLVVIGFMSGVFALFGQSIINLMNDVPEVRETAYSYLIFMVLAPPIGVLGWLLDGVFIGASHTRAMRDMSALSAGVFWIVLLLLFPVYHMQGLWVALLVWYAVRGLTLAAKYPAIIRTAR